MACVEGTWVVPECDLRCGPIKIECARRNQRSRGDDESREAEAGRWLLSILQLRTFTDDSSYMYSHDENKPYSLCICAYCMGHDLLSSSHDCRRVRGGLEVFREG